MTGFNFMARLYRETEETVHSLVWSLKVQSIERIYYLQRELKDD